MKRFLIRFIIIFSILSIGIMVWLEIDMRERTAMNNHAIEFIEKGKYAEGIEAGYKALILVRDDLGEKSKGYMTAIGNFAYYQQLVGEHVKAESLYLKAVMIGKESHSEKTAEYASVLQLLSGLYFTIGEYPKAMLYIEQAIKINASLYNDRGATVARSLNTMGLIYSAIGDYEKAEIIYKKSIDAWSSSKTNPSVGFAITIHNLAGLYSKRGDYEKAIETYLISLDILKKLVEPEHPSYATVLNGFAMVLLQNHEYDLALSHMIKVAEIRKKTLGKEHANYAIALNNLASIYREIAQYNKAEKLHNMALQVWEKSRGVHSYEYALGERNYATTLSFQGKWSEALHYLFNAESKITVYIKRNFPVITEKQKLAFVQKNQDGYYATLSLIQHVFFNDDKAVLSGLDLVLSRKGIVFDAQARQNEAIAGSLDPEAKKLWDKLANDRRVLSSLIQHKPSKLSNADYKTRITIQQEKVAALESQLASKSALVAEQVKQRNVTSKQLAATLGKDDALAEFVKIRDYDWAQNRWAKSYRYLVFVLKQNDSVELIDLGDADKLENKVQAALKPLGRIGTDSQLQEQASRALYDAVWQPLKKSVGSAKSVIVSPDGLLNLVPFNAMRDKSGKYLIESTQIAYVTSGRDLAKGDSGIKAEQTLYLAANPKFDLSIASASSADKNIGSTRSAGFSMQFSQLPGTEDEAKQIPSYLKGKQTVVTGRSATEFSVLHAKSSKVIHLATHGFFLQDQPSLFTENTRGAVALMDDDAPQAAKIPKGYENPMVRSGLALSGANHAKDAKGGDDGLLTALEVSGMNLHATDLVTLSACETGRGEVKTGEGVYGLRRAFALAGAKNLVMSLWPVSDAVTATQMQQFYQAYGKGESPAKAMRLAQLNTIKTLREKKGFAAPALWAPFMVQGRGQ